MSARSGEPIRLIAWPDETGRTRWVREDPQPVMKAVADFDFASAELSILEQYAFTRPKDDK